MSTASRGSAETVAAAFLVFITVTAVVAFYFYGPGLVTKQSTTSKPVLLSATVISNDLVTLKVLLVNQGQSTLRSGTTLFVAENNVSGVLTQDIPASSQAIVSFNGGYAGSDYKLFNAGTYTIYAAQLGQASVATVPSSGLPNATDRVVISPNASGDIEPDIVRASNGRLYAVWASNRTDATFRIYVANSSGGVSWGTTTSTGTDLNENRLPSLIQDSAGSFRIAWDQRVLLLTANLFTRNSSDGTNWVSTVQITATGLLDTAPSLLQASSGTFYLIRRSTLLDAPNLWIFNSTDAATWGTRTNVTNDTYDDDFPSLMQDSAGVYWLAFKTNRSGSSGIWVMNSTNTLQWNNATQVPTYGTPNRPSMLQDSSGTYWLAYDSADGNGNTFIWITESADGTNWISTSRVSNASSEHNPSLIHDPSAGKYYVVFEGNTSANDKDVFIRATTNAHLWSLP
jgi:hypothetical protein